MAVAWTEHRFSGGVLALDTANTVVLRGDPRTFDRFDDAQEIARFAEAASLFRADELADRALEAKRPEAIRDTVLGIRETTDALFRTATATGTSAGTLLSGFLKACAKGLEACDEPLNAPGRPFGDPSTPLAFEAALAVSALSLLEPQTTRRIKICANCNWLFVDRSRNSSRMWCDMKVCGNRQKAKRHYQRHRRGTDAHA
ncbi:MAG TPA: CGNR zinc finger domain-containing protein [Rhizobiaceae bacterium]|nr:CGNR zinc finger domain-containing protein [Rhizobiaceae bacterium]